MRINRTHHKLYGGMLLLACCVGRLQAGAYNLSAIVTGPDGLGFDLNGVHCSSIPPEVFGPSASAMAACSGITTAKTGPFNGSTFEFDGSAQANASPGVLNAQAVAGALNAPFDHLFHTGGGSTTAEATSHNGFILPASGMVTFAFTVTGSESVTGDTLAGGSMSFSPIGGGVQGFFLNNGTTLIQTSPVAFFQNVPFFYDWDLSVGVFLCASCNSQTTPLQYTGNGISDYSHTAILTGISITDSQGHPLSGVTFTSADGVDYNALLGGGAGGGAAVPEPQSLGLAPGALALFFVCRRQKSEEDER
jgi:hypothetical protein